MYLTWTIGLNWGPSTRPPPPHPRFAQCPPPFCETERKPSSQNPSIALEELRQIWAELIGKPRGTRACSDMHRPRARHTSSPVPRNNVPPSRSKETILSIYIYMYKQINNRTVPLCQLGGTNHASPRELQIQTAVAGAQDLDCLQKPKSSKRFRATNFFLVLKAVDCLEGRQPSEASQASTKMNLEENE